VKAKSQKLKALPADLSGEASAKPEASAKAGENGKLKAQSDKRFRGIRAVRVIRGLKS